MSRTVWAALCSAALLAGAEAPPRAEAVLDRFVEVTGGKAAYLKIHSEVAKGTMEIAGRGIKGSITSYQAEPNREYSVAELEGVGKVESGSDGDVVWEKSAIAGPRIKSDSEREEALRAAMFNPHVNWRKLYAKVELTGSEVVDGQDCYKVVLTPKTGNPSTEFYAKKSGLLLKSASVHATQMGDIAAEGLVKDYKTVSGVMTPFTRIDRFAGQEIQIHISSVEFNAEIPKDRFDLPEDIKALLRKSGGTNDGK